MRPAGRALSLEGTEVAIAFTVRLRQSEPVIDFGYDFALVDVETTGLYPQSDRVVQIAVRQADRHGKTQTVWHSLVDPGRDPGPTHIHGITAEMLRGAPRFTAVAPKVAELVAGRVLVAHNASFDWGFLQAESLRCVIGLESSHRLCTLALARRLDWMSVTTNSALSRLGRGSGRCRRTARWTMSVSWRRSSSS